MGANQRVKVELTVEIGLRLQDLVNKLFGCIIDLAGSLDAIELFAPLVANDDVLPAGTILAQERINSLLEVLKALLRFLNQTGLGDVGEQID